MVVNDKNRNVVKIWTYNFLQKRCAEEIVLSYWETIPFRVEGQN